MDREKVKAGIRCCATGNGCPEKTDPSCPYRICETCCDKAGLLLDANALIEILEEEGSNLDFLIKTIVEKYKKL